VPSGATRDAGIQRGRVVFLTSVMVLLRSNVARSRNQPCVTAPIFPDPKRIECGLASLNWTKGGGPGPRRADEAPRHSTVQMIAGATDSDGLIDRVGARA
jgi:hypothetical protein